MTAILETRELTVRYPTFTLGPLGFAIEGGETVALLGANAAHVVRHFPRSVLVVRD